MSLSRDEARLLSKDEQEIIAQTHHPELAQLEDDVLRDITTRLRDARDRAQTISRKQRREMRGKAAPSGTQAAKDNAGSVQKSSLLAAAMKRVNKERSSRRAGQAKAALVANARKALSSKRAAGDPAANRPTSRTPNEGMVVKANKRMAPSGALEQEGQRPVLERSRKVR